MGMCLIIFHKEHNTSCHSYNGQNMVKCDICDRFLKCPRNAQGIVAAAKPATERSRRRSEEAGAIAEPRIA